MIKRLESIGRTVQHLQRYRTIVRVFLKYGYQDIVQRLHLVGMMGIPLRKVRREQQELARYSQPERLRMALEELGPTFVKVGQLLSTRFHLLPPAFIHELARLQDEVTPVEFKEIRSVIEGELDRPVDEVFYSIEEEPLAAASIAQVHRACLATGEQVVVKVQRPGIRHTIEVDLQILKELARLMEHHLEQWRVHRPTRIVDEMARALDKEIDFTMEASHMERFAWQFSRESTVYVPKVYHEATTRKLLTMERVEGTKASHLTEEEVLQFDREMMARRITDLVMKQIFVHGFFHADPHPGNIVILEDQKVCFLDFGMMGYVNEKGRETFADFVWGITRRNEIIVTSALIKLSVVEFEPPREALEGDVSSFMHQHFNRPLKEVNFGELIGQLFQITTKYGLHLSADYFMMLKAMSLMESLVTWLNPQHDVMEQAAPFLREVRLGRMKPSKLIEDVFEFGFDFANMLREMPTEMRRIMAQIKTGEVKVIFKHEGLEPVVHAGDRVSNRLSFSIVLASLVVGSSMVVLAEVPPLWRDIPVIGLLGFVVAGLMAFWLLVSILRHGRM